MPNNVIINVVAFAENYLCNVSLAATWDISVGCMITQNAEFFGFEFKLADDHVVEGKGNTNMEALIHQGTIYVEHLYGHGLKQVRSWLAKSKKGKNWCSKLLDLLSELPLSR